MLILRTISSFLQAILPFIGFSFISLVVFDELTSPFNIIISVTILLLGIFSSAFVFNMMRKRGVIETMTGSASSKDLDNLESDEVQTISPDIFEVLFNENKISHSRCTISIWGDKFGRNLDQLHLIQSIKFDDSKKILKILFQNGSKLAIRNPSTIRYTTSYIKVINAKEVLWRTQSSTRNKNYYGYLKSKGKITTKSNTDWAPHKYDIGIGFDPVYIQYF